MSDVEQWFERYLDHCEHTRGLRPATIRGYRGFGHLLFRTFPTLTLNMLSSMETVDQFFKVIGERERKIGKTRTVRGLKISSIATYYSKFANFCYWLHASRYITTNPFAGKKAPKAEDSKVEALYSAEVKKIANAISSHNWGSIFRRVRNLAIFYLSIATGIRIGELIKLEMRDINFTKQFLTIRAEISKSKIKRIVPINVEAWAYLSAYLAERNRKKITVPFIFVSSGKDSGFTYHGIKHLMKKLKEISGVNFHIHQLRHTFGMTLASKNVNVFKIKLLMGHKDIRSTQAYLRTIPPDEMVSDVEGLTLDNIPG